MNEIFLNQIGSRVKELIEAENLPDELQNLVWEHLTPSNQPLTKSDIGSKALVIRELYLALNGQLDARIIEVSSAFELIFPFYDIIDDVQDGKFLEGLSRVETGQWLNV